MSGKVQAASNLRKQNQPNLQRLATRGVHARPGTLGPGIGFDPRKGALGRNQYTSGFGPSAPGLGVVNASQDPNDVTGVGGALPVGPQFNGVDPNQTLQGNPPLPGAPGAGAGVGGEPTLSGSLTNPLGPPSVTPPFIGGGGVPQAPADPSLTNALVQWLIQNGIGGGGGTPPVGSFGGPGSRVGGGQQGF